MSIMETLFDQEIVINNYMSEERKKNIKKGEKKEQKRIALKMIDEGVDMRFVCKMTGLSEKEFNKIALTRQVD